MSHWARKLHLNTETALIAGTFILKLFIIGKACIFFGPGHYGSDIRFNFICVAPKTGSYCKSETFNTWFAIPSIPLDEWETAKFSSSKNGPKTDSPPSPLPL